MTKFVTAAIVTAFAVVFTASAMAEGWRIGNWEPPKNEVSLVLKDVSLGTFQQPATVIAVQANCAGAISASCVGVQASCQGVRVNACLQAACFQQQAIGCAGRSGGRFLGWRIRRNRQSRAMARLGCN